MSFRISKTPTCYHCDAEGTGREHVPPKCLFPKGGDWSGLMTVPSCVAHNNAHSKADDYLKFLLGAIALNIPGAITSSAARSVVRLAQMGSGNLHKYGFHRNGDVLVIDNVFSLDFELLSACLEKMARAIYFYHLSGRRKLLGDLQVWPLFIPIDPRIAPELASAVATVQASTAQDFEQHAKLGLHQDIFAYQVFEGPGSVAINMEFYRGHRVSVMGVAEQAVTRIGAGNAR
ncbi:MULTISPECIES: hypothetical protein [Rugamonas]|uniref:HNH endonuclease n=1 Tax=Rugamonas rubra TaxID=758825 RepID=A0A1I4I7F5_9BURK|nr:MULTISPECIES: hypothetical protein [Rugamonas]WGG51432.1 hypothetical protein QC826_03990 [Rugamonas sp. DEMB1]SFL49701.1 hypothetical protein SAMN02982985_00493 [Rugamonas rubra]